MILDNIIVTFWFNKVEDIKNKINIFEQNLNQYFCGINSIGVPANIDPLFPRLNAISDGGHTKLNISMINFQLDTKFDAAYNSDYSKCFEYIKERIFKAYQLLTQKLGLKIIYVAIMASCEIENVNPVNTIQKSLLKENLNKSYSNIGVRYSEIVENKFYRNISLSSSKKVTISKKVTDNNELILPLIPLGKARIEENCIRVIYELNDKYSFDNNENYSLNEDVFSKMINRAEKEITNDILKLIRG